MLSCDGHSVARHTDEADKALTLRAHNGLQHTAGSEGCLPVRLVDEVVQLNQINLVGTKPLERPGDLRVRVVTPPLPGFRRQEQVRPVCLHSRPDPQLCVAVACGRVDVVDAVLAEQLHRVIRFGLRDVTESRGPEDGAGALVSSTSELQNRDHGSHCASCESGPAFGQQNGDQTLRALLIIGIRRVRRNCAPPPDLSFLALELACVGIESVSSVLDHQSIWIRLEVVIPLGMLRGTTLRGHQSVRAVMLNPHQGNLPDLAALAAAHREDHDRQAGVAQRVSFPPIRGFVALDLLSNPRLRTRLVLTCQRHAFLLSAQAASVRIISATCRASPISLTTCQVIMPEVSRTNEPRSAQPRSSSNTPYLLATTPCGQ